MAITLAVEEEFGYVILIGIASVLLGFSFGAHVFFARKYYKVPYPSMYSDANQKFNCIQRVHGNYLENLPMFLVFLFCGGLANPGYSAIAGLIYLLGKIAYAIGYSTGDPPKRLFGLFSYAGLLYLLYSSLRLAAGILKWF